MKRQMTLGKRLFLGFGFAITVSTILGMIAIFSLSRINKELTQVIKKNLPFVQEILQVRVYFTRIDSAENSLLSLNISSKEREEKFKQSIEDKSVIDKLILDIDGLNKTEEQKRLWEEFKASFNLWWKDHEEYVKLVKEFDSYKLQNPFQLRSDIRQFIADHFRLCNLVYTYILLGTEFEEGDDPTLCNLGKWLSSNKFENKEINTILENLKPNHQLFHEKIKQIKTLVAQGNKEEAINNLSSLQEVMSKTFSYIGEILAITDKVDETYSKMSDQALVKNMETYSKARDIVEKLVKDIQEEASRNGSSAIKTTSLAILIYIVVFSLGAVLTVLISVVISITVNRIVRDISSRIKEGALQVSSASEQVAQASQSLASSASEQASSNEETSASLEELTSMIQQNAANSSQAEQMMKETQGTIANCVTSLNKLLEYMDTLKKASTNTAGIIKTIDEIAFQTNLLALNAAVEAARAGEAGKGFAVVAEEVRRLAQRSAEAAKNTQQLIEDAIKSSEYSIHESAHVYDALQKVKEIADRVMTLISEVSTASNEQSKGVEQINTAVMEINKSTQEVAANSEESASASEELSAQANELLTLVMQLEALVGSTTTKSVNDEYKVIHYTSDNKSKRQVPKDKGDRRRTKNIALPKTGEKTAQENVISPEQVIPLDENDLKGF